VTVALLFILADQLGRVKTPSSHEGPGDRVGFSVRFRLSNRGNRSVFYPVWSGTNAPVGQFVMRTSPSSEWVTLSSASKQPVAGVQEFMDPNLTWVEMPPGVGLTVDFMMMANLPESMPM